MGYRFFTSSLTGFEVVFFSFWALLDISKQGQKFFTDLLLDSKSAFIFSPFLGRITLLLLLFFLSLSFFLIPWLFYAHNHLVCGRRGIIWGSRNKIEKIGYMFRASNIIQIKATVTTVWTITATEVITRKGTKVLQCLDPATLTLL